MLKPFLTRTNDMVEVSNPEYKQDIYIVYVAENTTTFLKLYIEDARALRDLLTQAIEEKENAPPAP